ncbi:Hypothetical protein NTJ_08654 [Nesidiocoris tenuis]|uniref:Uncharacterized protein n=1 Tax=Nesidiocoris tenuis TaxID=355587 RepID=A0ABN7AUI6_9HEMI|nr:Hypothetical protein NTJ_08654 [Nesidiocoris tenuis]
MRSDSEEVKLQGTHVRVGPMKSTQGERVSGKRAEPLSCEWLNVGLFNLRRVSVIPLFSPLLAGFSRSFEAADSTRATRLFI